MWSRPYFHRPFMGGRGSGEAKKRRSIQEGLACNLLTLPHPTPTPRITLFSPFLSLSSPTISPGLLSLSDGNLSHTARYTLHSLSFTFATRYSRLFLIVSVTLGVRTLLLITRLSHLYKSRVPVISSRVLTPSATETIRNNRGYRVAKVKDMLCSVHCAV